MKPEYWEKMTAWRDEELAELKKKGATPEDVKEPGFAQMLVDRIMKKHLAELQADDEFMDSLLGLIFEKGSPSDLRQIATARRGNGEAEVAYLFEEAADRRERGEFFSPPEIT